MKKLFTKLIQTHQQIKAELPKWSAKHWCSQQQQGTNLQKLKKFLMFILTGIILKFKLERF